MGLYLGWMQGDVGKGECGQEEKLNSRGLTFVHRHYMVGCVKTPPNHKKGSAGVNSRLRTTRYQRKGTHKPLEVDDESMQHAELCLVCGRAVGGDRGR